MSITRYIDLMPKADLNVSFEGTIRRSTWQLLAEQNEIASTMKPKAYRTLMETLENPKPSQFLDLTRQLGQWIRYPDDLTRLVYDVGIVLSKQNIRYAEVHISPSACMTAGMSFDAFINALEDGRDRVQRGWNVVIRWILTVARDEPRKADETIRWAASATARKHSVVGFGLLGPEDAQPIGQFERAFQTAQKKEVMTIVRVGDVYGLDGINEVFEMMTPNRLIDGYGLIDSSEIIEKMITDSIPLVLSPLQAVKRGFDGEDTFPLESYYKTHIPLTLSGEFTEWLDISLTDEYHHAVDQGVLSVNALNEMVLNTIRFSLADDELKQTLIDEIEQSFDELGDEYLEQAETVED
jgi:adenosine deaminase